MSAQDRTWPPPLAHWHPCCVLSRMKAYGCPLDRSCDCRFDAPPSETPQAMQRPPRKRHRHSREHVRTQREKAIVRAKQRVGKWEPCQSGWSVDLRDERLLRARAAGIICPSEPWKCEGVHANATEECPECPFADMSYGGPVSWLDKCPWQFDREGWQRHLQQVHAYTSDRTPLRDPDDYFYGKPRQARSMKQRLRDRDRVDTEDAEYALLPEDPDPYAEDWYLAIQDDCMRAGLG